VTYCNLQSTWGHDAFLLEVDTMTQLISDFLGRVVTQHSISLPEVQMPVAVRVPDLVKIDSDVIQS